MCRTAANHIWPHSSTCSDAFATLTTVDNSTHTGSTGVANAGEWHIACPDMQAHPEDVIREQCALCHRGDDHAHDWVCCDTCDNWVHFSCDSRSDLGSFKVREIYSFFPDAPHKSAAWGIHSFVWGQNLRTSHSPNELAVKGCTSPALSLLTYAFYADSAILVAGGVADACKCVQDYSKSNGATYTCIHCAAQKA